jgi:hypothetical protein
MPHTGSAQEPRRGYCPEFLAIEEPAENRPALLARQARFLTGEDEGPLVIADRAMARWRAYQNSHGISQTRPQPTV